MDLLGFDVSGVLDEHKLIRFVVHSKRLDVVVSFIVPTLEADLSEGVVVAQFVDEFDDGDDDLQYWLNEAC